MPLTSRFSVAWALTLAPIVLFIPAFLLAGMGPCTFSHPSVMVLSFLIFIGFELAALRCFVNAARAAGKVMVAVIGMGLASVLLVLNATLGVFIVSDYL